MGIVKVDLTKGEKRLDQIYPIYNEVGVKAILENIHHLRVQKYSKGDYDLANLLLDFKQALEECNLSLRQYEVLQMVYEQDMRQEDVAKALDISQQGVSQHIAAAIKKIALYNHVREDKGRCMKDYLQATIN